MPGVSDVAPVVSTVTLTVPATEAALVTASLSALELPRLNLKVAPVATVKPAVAKLACCWRLQVLTKLSVISNVWLPRFRVAPAVPATVVPRLIVVALPG